MERIAALGNSSLGRKRIKRHGFLGQICGTNLLSAVSHFCEHRQLKGWHPRFHLREAKNWISTILHWLAAVAYIRQPRSQSIACNPKLGYHNSIFCKHDATDATITQSWWNVLPLSGTQASGRKRIKRHGFLGQTCGTNLFSAVSHFCENRQLKGWHPRFHLRDAKSWISTIFPWLAAVAFVRQPSQSIACNPQLGYHNSIFCKHDATDATITQSWWSVLSLSGTSSFW